MPNPRSLTLVLAFLVMAGIACDETKATSPTQTSQNNPSIPTHESSMPKGDRILELDANAPENKDYDQVMDLARELGVESIRLSVFWDDIETGPGIYNPDPNWLAIANQYYSAQEFAISLTISVLDTTEIRLPDDLENRSFTDPEVQSRFKGLLDYIKTQLVDVELVYLAIGNEIDGVLGSDLSAWEDYREFYEPTAEYAREIWPGLPVSTKVTYDGLTGPMSDAARVMFLGSDVVMTTYYPLNGDFTVRDPDVILQDFRILADLYDGKEIQITEIGFPSGAENGSSPDKQAEFIHYMFQAWDEHRDQITVLSYSWLSDLSQNSVKEYESYYGLSNKTFGEFLRTLGLRTYQGSGENKIGFDVFQTEANLRGW